MLCIIESPVDGKQMLMQRGGNGGFADVAEQITVQIFVRQNFVPLAAQTSMPVVGFVGIPFVDKQMLVQGRGNSNSTSIAAAVAIQVGMGGNVNGLTAQTTAPMITLVEIPAVAEIVLMQTGGNDRFTNIAGLAAV